ncbi:metal-dependent transcriptional regulator [Cellulomonas endophytica]|uniref:metal-dependent transcriptional regulator n=1 Tax=Cellulomonas endophytica TaxID=2494735 RepID=UPI0010106500|nr:metal-dependent transcriptional regulator [Cellulomonas endophytica]
MSDLIDTTEMYLKTIYELTEEGRTPLRARIAERLGHSGPTVSQTVARMERDGLLVVSGDRHLELTPAGEAKAVRVMRKHRLAERLLTDVIGLEWPYVHEEACRWEHVMSERVERRLAALLHHPQHDPYGNPIPGLDEIGEQGALEGFLDGVVPLSEFGRRAPALAATGTAARSAGRPVTASAPHAGGGVAGTVRDAPAPEEDEGTEAVVARIAEPLQVDVELLAQFADAGLRPGARVVVRHLGGGRVQVGAAGAEGLELDDEVARHVFVGAPAA